MTLLSPDCIIIHSIPWRKLIYLLLTPYLECLFCLFLSVSVNVPRFGLGDLGVRHVDSHMLEGPVSVRFHVILDVPPRPIDLSMSSLPPYINFFVSTVRCRVELSAGFQ